MSQATEHSSTPFDVSAFKPEGVSDWFAVWQYRVALDHMLTIASDGDSRTPEYAAMKANWEATRDAAERVACAPADSSEAMRRKLAVLRWELEDMEPGERHRWAPLLDGIDADLTGGLSEWRRVPADVIQSLADHAAKALAETSQAIADLEAQASAEGTGEELEAHNGYMAPTAYGAALRQLEFARFQVEALQRAVACVTGGSTEGEGSDDA